MRFKKSLALTCILLPAVALGSLNCGIIALPVEGPKALVANARSLEFSVDIVDASGQPLDDVTVTATRHALKPEMFFVETDDRKPDRPVVVDKKFDYKTFGNFAVEVRYEKPGFIPHTTLYGESYNIRIPAVFMRMPVLTNDTINLKQTPHPCVTLIRNSTTEPGKR